MKTLLISCALVSSVLVLVGCAAGDDSPPVASDPSASSSSRPSPPAGAIVVSATSYRYTPSTVTLQAGKEVTLFFTNDSPDDDHDLQSDIPITGLVYAHADNDATELDDDVKNEKLDVDFHANGWAQVSFTPTKPGTFDFACGEGDHKERGMTGTFVVTP